MTDTLLVPSTDVRRAGERFATRLGWLDSKHSFSFGHHYDPRNTSFGLLLVSNDDVVAPGSGFETHAHRDMEIVTWVLEGGLVHQDSEGHSGVVYPGLAQRMSAGSGILHSEKNDAWRLQGGPAHEEPVHFVQMWVLPDEPGIAPGYEQLDINPELDRGGLVTVASGREEHREARAIRIRQRAAALHAARLRAGGAARGTVRAPVRRQGRGRAGGGGAPGGRGRRTAHRGRRAAGHGRRRRRRGAGVGDAHPPRVRVIMQVLR